MRVMTGKGRPRSKTKSSYFLDHWVGLCLGLCSRASYLELFACGLSFTEHLEFLGVKQYVQSRLKAQLHFFKDPNWGALLNRLTDVSLPQWYHP